MPLRTLKFHFVHTPRRRENLHSEIGEPPCEQAKKLLFWNSRSNGVLGFSRHKVSGVNERSTACVTRAQTSLEQDSWSELGSHLCKAKTVLRVVFPLGTFRS